MPRCSICMQQRRSFKFRTGRLSICGPCVSSLNRTKLSARSADLSLRQKLREGILLNDPGAVDWVDRWLATEWSTIKAEWLQDAERVRKSHALKVLRAYERGLVCLDRRYLDYPANWSYRRFLIVHLDDYACRVCGARRDDGAELHVHHIVFRSKSGTSDRRNLVTLCFNHHQAQHDHPITCRGGEGPGRDIDATNDADADAQAYAALLPRMQAVLHYLRRAEGKCTRYEFFRFLIELNGNEIGPIALRFAQEQRLRRDLSMAGEPEPDDDGAARDEMLRLSAAAASAVPGSGSARRRVTWEELQNLPGPIDVTGVRNLSDSQSAGHSSSAATAGAEPASVKPFPTSKDWSELDPKKGPYKLNRIVLPNGYVIE